MALIKHRHRKTQCYNDALTYLYYQHEQDEYKHYYPILHENGYLIERDSCIVTCVTAEGKVVDSEFWESLSMRTAWKYRKDRVPGSTTMHHYIVSHAKEDGQRLSDEALLQKGMAIRSLFFSGSDALIAVHRDTEHIHLHIVISAVRRLAREPQDWMMRGKTGDVLPSEIEAGGKHQSSPALWKAMENWDMKYAETHGLTKEDFVRKADENKKMRFAEQNERLRAAVIAAAEKSANMQDLQQILLKDYGVKLKLSARDGAMRLLSPGHKNTVGLSVLKLTQKEVVGLFIRENRAAVDNDAVRNAKAVAQAEEHAKKEEERRRRAAKDKKQNYSKPSSTYSRTARSDKIKFYDETGREMFTLEVLLRLVYILMFPESGVWIPSTVHPDKMNEACYATTDWKVQNRLDALYIWQELGITGVRNIDERLEANSKIYRNAKEVLDRNTAVKERLEDLEKAIWEFERTRDVAEELSEMPESPEKDAKFKECQEILERHQAAKAIMDLYDVKFDEQRLEFKIHWKKLMEELATATKQLEQNNEEYKKLRKLNRSIKQYECELMVEQWKQSRKEELSQVADKKSGWKKKKDRGQER